MVRNTQIELNNGQSFKWCSKHCMWCIHITLFIVYSMYIYYRQVACCSIQLLSLFFSLPWILYSLFYAFVLLRFLLFFYSLSNFLALCHSSFVFSSRSLCDETNFFVSQADADESFCHDDASWKKATGEEKKEKVLRFTECTNENLLSFTRH